ncbi:penicillin acylase family protein [Endozoicomonas sp. SESOKO1]|uniref:penicillin acylase family protein n=1 Tax=Endozoicomonas sp. SESOKO1 TaxID=2828742 RepID=UPI0021494E31|nr:penicillin acylase family protein [Endozoicomonas sp. SESOKO1]
MLIWFRRGFFLLVSISLLIILTVFVLLRQSLPILEGEVKASSLKASVTIERDARGIPLISGSDRKDVAFAIGYLHAQERFFQMDLNRRNSAGELSELVGELALDHDRRQRKHRFRKVARQAVEIMNSEHQALLQAYTDGVNQGQEDLGQKPFEYLLLGVEPQPWKNEDSYLSIFSMYMDLNDDEVKLDNLKGFLSRVTVPAVIDFLSPLKTRWDSPMQPDELQDVPTPGADLVDLRSKDAELYANLGGTTLEDRLIGSNNWAVSGELTNHGGAIIQDDMHLSHRVPTIWYRASLSYPHPEQPQDRVSITGVSLPGTPFIVVGSNTHIAWGFTNTAGDWVDLVALAINDGQYMTNDGPRPLERWTETINIKGQEPVSVEYSGTHWGPVVDSVYDDTQYALRWTAHRPEATNVNLVYLEVARNVEQGMAIANRSGIPPQNFTVGDREGNIGWTVAGQIPNRSGIDSTYPLPWQQADDNWDGWLPDVHYPRVYNPADKRVWTANARIVSGEDYDKIGNGGYALGPRQIQIRDALMALEHADEQALLEIALDHRAIYMNNWRQLILDTLTEAVIEGNPARQTFYHYVQNWSGKAATDDVGYRLVREYNDALKLKIMSSLGRYFLSLSPEARDDVEDGFMQKLNHESEMIWRLLDERPIHWLSPQYESWDQLLVETVDQVVSDLGGEDQLASATWGERNTADIRHPLSGAIPVFGKLLNMPAVPLSGDIWMPRAQRSDQGVSERMVVSPGREDEAIFHMPGGQSGHPLSPFFTAGYMDWVEGKASPFLPGDAKYTLTLTP